MDILDAPPGDGFHHQVGHPVAVPQMMVEGNGHPIPQTDPVQCLFQAHRLALPPLCTARDPGRRSLAGFFRLRKGALVGPYLSVTLNILGKLPPQTVFQHSFLLFDSQKPPEAPGAARGLW